MIEGLMFKVYAVFNFIGNDRIHNFEDFIDECVKYCENDLWLVTYHECEIDDSMKDIVAAIKVRSDKDMRIFFCEDIEDVETVIAETFECFGGPDPAPDSDLELHTIDLGVEEFKLIHSKIFKEVEMDRGRCWTENGWVEIGG